MNSLCAAGTGSFLDQQAKRLGNIHTGRVWRAGLKSVTHQDIAGRCSVFAKSDMIHLQQIATPLHDIVAGLCFCGWQGISEAQSQGQRSCETRPFFREAWQPIQEMVRAFRENIWPAESELIIPVHYASWVLGRCFCMPWKAIVRVTECPELAKLEENLNNGSF
jgi:activator of 2-hydroxyglutaryl-CoA dehydratase